MRFRMAGFGLISMFVNVAVAATDPLSWSMSGSLPPKTSVGNSYLVVYTFTSHLPFTMPTALSTTVQTTGNEFTITDECNGQKLTPGKSCNVSVGLNPKSLGNKTIAVKAKFNNTTIAPPVLTTTTLATSLDSTWVGLIGVDYNPNHYPANNQFNGHDVFYSGTANSNAVTNTYAEIAQLKAAGFTAVRSYQTIAYSWIDIINSASALGIKVIYEADIPQNGSQTDITNAVNVLKSVIGAVGASVFSSTVMLVFAGHENYSNTDINYLTSAISQLQSALSSNGAASIPVGSALVSGNLVTPGSPSDMQTLINSYSASAPLGFDPYPFQWGVMPPDQAVSNMTLQNAIAWDYSKVQQQIFYVSPRPILMAETGWATSGTGQFAGYFCYANGGCFPSVANAATYLTALYKFVKTTGNNSGALVFEAYDEPAKDPGNPTDAENFYGVFDTNCNLKNNNTSLLPNTNFSTTSNLGCQGYINGALFVVVGTQPGNLTNQPPFTVQVTQTNPTTGKNASFTVTIPNQNRTDSNVYPWPQYLAFNGASITITGVTSGASCSTTATVTNQVMSFSSMSCTNPSYPVNCTGSVCFLPFNNF